MTPKTLARKIDESVECDIQFWLENRDADEDIDWRDESY